MGRSDEWMAMLGKQDAIKEEVLRLNDGGESPCEPEHAANEDECPRNCRVRAMRTIEGPNHSVRPNHDRCAKIDDRPHIASSGWYLWDSSGLLKRWVHNLAEQEACGPGWHPEPQKPTT